MLNESNFTSSAFLAIFNEYVAIINKYAESSYRAFLADLFNVTENMNTEMVSMDGHCIDKLFAPQTQNYVDRGGADSFLEYLLLLLRYGKDSINGTCAAYENHRDELSSRIKKIIHTADPVDRLRGNIVLGEWIIKNVPEIKWEN